MDFNSFSWHTLFLLGGGDVLGKAIKSSKLLEILANAVVDFLPKVRATRCYRSPSARVRLFWGTTESFGRLEVMRSCTLRRLR